jgi:hypothetical protein
MKYAYDILVKNMKGRNHLRDLGVDGRILLKWALKEQGMKVWTEIIWLLARDRDTRWARLNRVILNLRVP